MEPLVTDLAPESLAAILERVDREFAEGSHSSAYLRGLMEGRTQRSGERLGAILAGIAIGIALTVAGQLLFPRLFIPLVGWLA